MRGLLLVALLAGCMGGGPGPNEVTSAGPAGHEAPPLPADAPGTVVPAPDAPAPEAPVAPAPDAPAPALVTPDPPTPALVPPAPGRTAALLTSAPDSLWACTADNDCVVECDIPGNCCGAPCGCTTAVNWHVLAELKTQPWAKCTREEHHRLCPAVGCAYEPATGAHCEAGRCRADFGGPLEGLRFSDAPAPASCTATVNSTLPGVTINVLSPKCTVPVAAARIGQVLYYNVVITTPPAGRHQYDKVDAGGCADPGPSGLLFRASVVSVDDPSRQYAITDTGLCAPGDRVSEIVAGTHGGQFAWKGVEWSGPSDFGNPEGAPFEAGRYEIRLSASGTVGGSPYKVEATVPVTLVP